MTKIACRIGVCVSALALALSGVNAQGRMAAQAQAIADPGADPGPVTENAEGARGEGAPGRNGSRQVVRAPQPDLTDCTTGSGQTVAPNTPLSHDCIIRILDHNAYSADVGFSDVHWYGGRLSQSYRSRSVRRQFAVDSGALLSGVGGLGYAAGGGLLQTLSGVAAVTPILAMNVTTVEPTRDLFHAASEAVTLIGERYENLDRLPDPGGLGAGSSHDEGKCRDVGERLRDTRLRSNTAERALLLGPVSQMAEACRHIAEGEARIADISQEAPQRIARLWRRYARDLVELDDVLMQRARGVRHSPVEALSLMAAAPFRVVDHLITGQGGDAAGAPQAHPALSGVMVVFNGEPLPMPPELLTGRIGDYPALDEVRSDTGNPTPNGGTAPNAAASGDDLPAMVRWIDDTAPQLEAMRLRYNARADAARRLASGLGPYHIIFTRDEGTRRPRPVLVPGAPARPGP